MLSTWLTCKEKFRLKYVERMKEPEGIYFAQGNTIHAALYDFHQTPDIDSDLLIDMANAYWDEQTEMKEYYSYQGARLSAQEVEEGRVDTLRWLRGYVDLVKAGEFPFIEFATPPEQDISSDVDGTLFTARGYVDFFPGAVKVLPTGEVLMKCTDGSVHIGDFKTGSANKSFGWNQVKADIDLQPTVYGYIMGKKPMTFHYIVIEKTTSRSEPSVKHLITKRGKSDYDMFERIVKDFQESSDRANSYKKGVFYPEPTMGWGKFCSKLCSFKDTCWEINYAREDGED
jgi:hypothetical protein